MPRSPRETITALVFATLCVCLGTATPTAAQDEPNAAAAPKTGFVVADELPALFRSFAPGARHDITLNAARMGSSSGFVVSSYRPNVPTSLGPSGAENPHVSVTLVTGSSASWLVSIAGNRMTGESTSTDHSATGPPNTSETDILTKSLASETDAELRVVRLLPSSSDWHRAVGIRLGLERSDTELLNERSTSSRSFSGVPDGPRTSSWMESDSDITNTADMSRLRAALELGFFNGRTDLVAVAGIDLLSVDKIDVSATATSGADTSASTFQEVVTSHFNRLATGATVDANRPVFSLGTSVRTLVAEVGPASHYITFQGGARYGRGTVDLLEYESIERIAIIAIDDFITFDGPQIDDSVSTGSFSDPIERRIFAGGGYMHQQQIGRIELTTGVGIQTDFSLMRSTEAPVDADYPLLRRLSTQQIDWLVPAFMVYHITEAVGLFAGAVFDLSYGSATTRFESTDGDTTTSRDRRTGTLGTAYHAGLVVDRAGFFGQVGFDGDLGDYRGWRLTLGLDL